MPRTFLRRAGSVTLAVPALLGLLLCGCKDKDTTTADGTPPPAATVPAPSTPPASPSTPPTAPATPSVAPASSKDAPIVTMVTTQGTILIKLFPKDAPISCANFEKLVKKGFYNGLSFHRITDLGDPGASKIVQGGDPNGDGSGGPGYTIKGEFSANNVQNPLTHNAGAVAMARTGDQTSGFDTAGSQFYICVNPVHFLDGQYAVFGQVIKGLDVADKLVQGQDKMTKVTVSP